MFNNPLKKYFSNKIQEKEIEVKNKVKNSSFYNNIFKENSNLNVNSVKITFGENEKDYLKSCFFLSGTPSGCGSLLISGIRIMSKNDEVLFFEMTNAISYSANLITTQGEYDKLATSLLERAGFERIHSSNNVYHVHRRAGDIQSVWIKTCNDYKSLPENAEKKQYEELEKGFFDNIKKQKTKEKKIKTKPVEEDVFS